MLLAMYGGPVRAPGEKVSDSDNSYLYRSTDHGKTWKRYATIGAKDFNETVPGASGFRQAPGSDALR